MELIFKEGDFIVKALSAHEEMEEAFRLRHDVFCDELKWVPPSPDGLEMDPYDDFSDLIGVFDPDRRLVGHIRLTASPHPFMVEKEFACILPEGVEIAKGPRTSEVTRLCVRKEDRMVRHPVSIPNMLYKGMYQWSLAMGMRVLVIVVDKRCFRHLRSIGLTVDPLGPFFVMPDGVSASVCYINWDKFERVSSERKPGFLEWMSTLKAPCPSLSQPHGPYSRRRACARYSAHGT
ncbi:MAG: acyl-homoserine-lactone synthase [Thermodesulfobacteriota bacterium]